MGKFRIYIKSKNFVWTRGRIILFVLIFTILIFGFENFLLKNIDDNVLNKTVGFIMILSFVLGLINNFFREELKGELSGYIIFSDEEIQIDKKTYHLNEIRSIKFEGYDFLDKIVLYNFPNGMFSIGVDNTLSIILNSGEVISVNFQKNYENELRKVKKQLTNYLDKNKLTKQNYIDTLDVNENIFHKIF
ncbi:MAG: hypothetical protein QM564_00825 [Bergeyella sp.]